MTTLKSALNREKIEKLKNKLPSETTWENEPLSKHTYFRLGGPADLFTITRSTDELEKAVREAVTAGVPHLILGGGSNILVGDLGFRGLVIKNESRKICCQGTVITAESGVQLNRLVADANKHGLRGLEMFLSVPGTVGGAIYNNSHFRPEKGEYIGNLVKSAKILVVSKLKNSSLNECSNFKKLVVDRDWFKFDYDYSRLQDTGAVLLEVSFGLVKANSKELKDRSLKLTAGRNIRQPVGEACSGCVFKNSEGISAGKLIDEAGMKEQRVGGAYVSDKHANFIINDGKASSQDVLELMSRIKQKVKESRGVILEPEIILVGEFENMPENLKESDG